jgi:prepilin peptidase CpaA
MIKDFLLLTIFPAGMAFAAATDLITMTVPNRLIAILTAGFFLAAALAGLSWSDIGLHMAVAGVALIVGFALFVPGWIGGGDAKLFAATALWIGPSLLLDFSLIAALIGGVLTLCIILLRSLPLPTALNDQGWLLKLHDAKAGVPYGIALAAAGLLVYPYTAFMGGLGG